ncbi:MULTISPECIES: ABC transporter permease subunit [Bacillus]|uniref:ABC transporter permease subunit n=1 Tax=Bacillus TaxID=1386 RepID=UPI000375C1DF|nr:MULTISPECIES: ABC transporter permease subunit [Bacillus]PEB40026.1 acetoin ABC transporter permease [Bacillus pseudomycoides]PGD99530.1 acetoin ABC transporter permease [Bacillus pseudomycoides]PGE00572.1 acetoin ABC transporter permease [Bacillus pseudomycoides]PHE66818.1 acetoin ABC transporter permease [Bacillus pseudomycoides]PHG23390.1 acetoin ABC transporter permease [Bacillus pseudomycoides]
MFHKALWIRQWKQGKYIVLLFWLISLYQLPYKYYQAAQMEINQSKMKLDDYTYYYSYYFQTSDGAVLFQGAALIALACLLIGWERNNQSTDFLFSMPFKRKDIFLTKWLLGVLNIITVQIVCWISMYGIKNMSFHNEYQIFTPFHSYFLYATVVLIAIYTFTLFIGTITGHIFSQSSLTAILLFLPYGSVLLISGFIYTHTQWSLEAMGEIERHTHEYLQHVGIISPLESFSITFDYHPIETFDDQGNKLSSVPQDDPMEHTSIPSPWTLLTPFTYIITLLPIATFLYTRTPNEQNGKILLFPKLQKWFMLCTVLCFGLLGGRIFGGRDALLSYYIGFFLAAIISYFVFTRLLKLKFSFGGK